MTTVEKKSRFGEEQILMDLEDYVDAIDPGFELIGDKDIEKISTILGQASQNNIIYVGPSGVGKSATLMGIARRRKQATENPELATKTGLPLHMVDRRYMLMNVNALFDFEDPKAIERDIHLIFSELEKPGNHVLVIEDANDLLKGIQDNQCYGLISSLMNELKKGKFQTIWMVRDEVAKNKLEEVLHCHSEMRELFTVLDRKPPSKEETVEILKAYEKRLEKHFEGLDITDDAVNEVVSLTNQYSTLSLWTREQPSRSLTLLDRVASTFVSRGQTMPPELRTLKDELHQVTVKIEAGEKGDLASRQRELQGQVSELEESWKKQSQQLYVVMGRMREEENKLYKAEKELKEEKEKVETQVKEDWKKENKTGEPTQFNFDQAETDKMKLREGDIDKARKNLEIILAKASELKLSANRHLTLRKEDVQSVFSEISGIPAADLDADESEKILGLGGTIKERVFGQDPVVDIVADTIKSGKAGLKGKKRPFGVFICLGSSGVGKSFPAEVTAQALFGKKDGSVPMTAFDMSEFMEKHTVSMLKGAPPGYAGYGQGGRLTNAVRGVPYQAILLDEIEKAHPDIFKILLQVFNDGRLSDELGTVRYNNTVFFLTTNIAQEMALEGKVDPQSPEGRKMLMEALKEKGFPQEFLNRVDEFLLFAPLGHEDIVRIVKRDIKDLNKSDAVKDKEMTVYLSDEDIDRIVTDKYRVEEGARQVQKFIENRMSPLMVPYLLRKDTKGGTLVMKYAAEKNSFECSYVPADGVVPANQNKKDAPQSPNPGSAFGKVAPK